ncbi:MAG: hypothetical protein VX447_18710 [Pseudomonadota bacterium]|nr:hypothetical protein [Pseudomonadota bacterium]
MVRTALLGLLLLLWLAGSLLLPGPWLARELAPVLDRELPPLLAQSLEDGADWGHEQGWLDYINRRLAEDGQHLASANPWLSCTLQSRLAYDAPPGHWQQRLSWPIEGRQLYLGYGFSCRPKPLPWGLASLLLVLLLGSLCWWLPAPLNRRSRQWLALLLAKGHGAPEALAMIDALPAGLEPVHWPRLQLLHQRLGLPLSLLAAHLDRDLKHLDAEGFAWYVQAAGLGLGHLEAVAVANSPPGLSFDLAAGRLCCHGLWLDLPKTPLFYLYWYAMAGRQGDGWLTNPRSDRPQLAEGQALAALMAAHGGHQKAISDLREQGLKAKSLDQNRSKIKDELQAKLGELAEPYLFESRRDLAAARSAYRLQLPSERIQLIV